MGAGAPGVAGARKPLACGLPASRRQGGALSPRGACSSPEPPGGQEASGRAEAAGGRLSLPEVPKPPGGCEREAAPTARLPRPPSLQLRVLLVPLVPLVAWVPSSAWPARRRQTPPHEYNADRA